MIVLINALIAAYNAEMDKLNEDDRWTAENLLVPEDVLRHLGWYEP